MKNFATPIAIFVGFGLVATAIFVSSSQSGPGVQVNAGHDQMAATADTSPRRENSEQAFVYGNPDAEITVVEFSDYECLFCSRLHPTLERLVDESDGKINWEYRHLPIPSHRNAELAASIAECVGRIQGNDAFWAFSQVVFDNQRSVNNTFLTKSAGELGVPEDQLQACMAEDAIGEQIATDIATARAFGGSGTPFNVIVFPDGTTQSVSGALPYESWAQLLTL
ncbi:MAG: protein-disulfide isomerase [Candidatus Azotimanducaceae bacterium]|jgi:protein-disulfide isomerase